MSALVANRRRLAVLIALATAGVVLAAFLIITAGPATAKEFATLRVIEGTVDVQRGAGSFESGREGQTLQAGDTVRTASDGRAEIEYFDGSLTRLDGDTTFTLRELASMPDEPDSKVIEAEQAEGRTFERVTEITDSQSRFDVETPTATASVRGTSYVLTVHPDGTTEIWVLPDDEPGTSTVVLILGDGTEIVVSEGQGVRVTASGSIDGPFALTADQLEDGFVLFNLCLDQPDHPDCQVDVGPEVIENDGQEQEEEDPFEPPPSPPTQPEVVEPSGTTGAGGGGGGDGGGGGANEEPSDRRSVVITLSWSSGPTNLDLHVLTPDVEEDEGGEVWAGNPCLARQDGTCWAFASGDAVAFGSETVTLRPLGRPADGDWLKGGYRVWVENTSCQDATFASSDAAVTVSRAGGESVSLPVSGTSGDRSLETWNVGSVFMTQDGAMAVVGTQSMVGDPCGPPPIARHRGVGERGYQAVQPPVGKVDRDGGGSETPPPAPEPEPEPQPEPQPAPEPEPSPEPEPEPEPEPPPEPEPEPQEATLPEEPVAEAEGA